MTLEQLVNYAKTYGYIFQGSEIYGGLSNTWDYGPLGVTLKRLIKDAWWDAFITHDAKVVGLDSALLMHPKTWEASGHVGGFSDPLIDCKSCKTRHRADHLIESADLGLSADGLDKDALERLIDEHAIQCPKCGAHDFTPIRAFNLMFKTQLGVTENNLQDIYLRPETAQGIFLNYKNVQRTSRLKVPFGIGQIGKSFRNEITPGNFIFRTREFEQAELEFFCEPGTEKMWFDAYKEKMRTFLRTLGLPESSFKFADHPEEKLSHYSNATTDIMYEFPWGYDELWGLASRTDYDLTQHQTASGVNLEYIDPLTNARYLPYVVEPSLGIDRLFLALIHAALREQEIENGTRTLLAIDPSLAPVQVAVLPLIKKRHKALAESTFQSLLGHFRVQYDEAGAIGRRYRRQDAIGTPVCVTIDDDSLEQETVTLRMRDSMDQITIPLKDLPDTLSTHLTSEAPWQPQKKS